MIADLAAAGTPHAPANDARGNAPLTILGPDTHIKGEMFFSGPAQILGAFEGRITSKSEVLIGQGAMCKASIEAARVIIEGTVEGDITAHERAELHPSACVTGDLAARSLIVEEGATFTGHFRVGIEPAAVKPERHAPSNGSQHAAGAVIESRTARPAARPSALAARAQRLAEATAELDGQGVWQGTTG